MINPKYIGIAAGVGFVLSFLIGIFSGISFGLVLLRALICAVIFAAVGAGGSFLYQKFLSDGQSETVSDAPVEKVSRTGGVVDITIGDETLPEDEQGPRFNVGMTRSSLKAAGLASEGARPQPQFASYAPSPAAPMAQEAAQAMQQEVPPQPAVPADSGEAASFQPMNLVDATTASASSPAPAAQPVPQEAPVSSGGGESAASDGLEELPDIGFFSSDSSEEDGEGAGEIVSDSEFAMEDDARSFRSSSSSGGTPATEQSASVMAQAIRTILAKN